MSRGRPVWPPKFARRRAWSRSSFRRAAALSRFASMMSCSIPSSKPASGRISTRSRAKSKRACNSPADFLRPMPLVGRDRWARQNQDGPAVRPYRLANRRVKGAWWPSRSSKPLSVRSAGRGRFDSYPLRRFIFEFQPPNFDFTPARSANRKSRIKNRKFVKGGER